MSVNEFRSALTGGGARPNQFRVELTFPGFVTGATNAGRKAQFLCTAAQLPESNVGSIQVPYRGRVVHVAGERTFQPWSISILNDTDFAIRDAFESWMHTINNVKENTGLTNPNMYTANMTVHQLDRNNATLKSYTFSDAWPTNVGAIQLGFSDDNTIESFNVQFVYTYWEAKTTSSSLSATVGLNTPIGGIGISI